MPHRPTTAAHAFCAALKAASNGWSASFAAAHSARANAISPPKASTACLFSWRDAPPSARVPVPRAPRAAPGALGTIGRQTRGTPGLPWVCPGSAANRSARMGRIPGRQIASHFRDLGLVHLVAVAFLAPLGVLVLPLLEYAVRFPCLEDGGGLALGLARQVHEQAARPPLSGLLARRPAHAVRQARLDLREDAQHDGSG